MHQRGTKLHSQTRPRSWHQTGVIRRAVAGQLRRARVGSGTMGSLLGCSARREKKFAAPAGLYLREQRRRYLQTKAENELSHLVAVRRRYGGPKKRPTDSAPRPPTCTLRIQMQNCRGRIQSHVLACRNYPKSSHGMGLLHFARTHRWLSCHASQALDKGTPLPRVRTRRGQFAARLLFL